MANAGKRCYCRCIKEMTIIISKKEEVLFAYKKIYPCQMRTSDTQMNNYKIYGEEFALSCSESEFKEYFRLIEHHSYQE